MNPPRLFFAPTGGPDFSGASGNGPTINAADITALASSVFMSHSSQIGQGGLGFDSVIITFI